MKFMLILLFPVLSFSQKVEILELLPVKNLRLDSIELSSRAQLIVHYIKNATITFSYEDTVSNVGYTINLDTMDVLIPSLFIKLKNNDDKSLVIARAFTSDPHFINSYPKEPILPGETFEIGIYFAKSRYGRMNKVMGLKFQDGTKISFKVKGEVPYTKSKQHN